MLESNAPRTSCPSGNHQDTGPYVDLLPYLRNRRNIVRANIASKNTPSDSAWRAMAEVVK